MTQGLGKTKWIKRLVPAELNVLLVGKMLDLTDKDSITNAVSHWIVELGELDATFRKADIARLKSFVTNPVDKIRRPYDKLESEYQRRTVFSASVNEGRYLVDDTGNRRWWTVPCTKIDYEHTIDVQQVWAEMLIALQAGEQWHLTPDEFSKLSLSNQRHEAIDPLEESVRSMFDFGSTDVVEELTATQVLIALGRLSPTKAQATQMSSLLRKLTGKDPTAKASGRFFAMPPRLPPDRTPPNDKIAKRSVSGPPMSPAKQRAVQEALKHKQDKRPMLRSRERIFSLNNSSPVSGRSVRCPSARA